MSVCGNIFFFIVLQKTKRFSHGYSFFLDFLISRLIENLGYNYTIFLDILVSTYFRHFGSDGYCFILASLILLLHVKVDIYIGV